VRDLYKALAKVLGLPSEDPQKLLLLAEYDSRHTLSMHSEGSEALSTVGTTNGGGFYSSSKPLLLAYHYASSDQGPSSGKQLLVYHRCCSQFVWGRLTPALILCAQAFHLQLAGFV